MALFLSFFSYFVRTPSVRFSALVECVAQSVRWNPKCEQFYIVISSRSIPYFFIFFPEVFCIMSVAFFIFFLFHYTEGTLSGTSNWINK